MLNGKLKVLTYNIHKGFDISNRRFILHDIRDELQASDSDIVFLQEIHGQQQRHEARFDNWPTVSQFEFLADRIWPHYAYGKNAIYTAGHHGNAILSKYPFEFQENINLSAIRRASRSLLHGIIRNPQDNTRLHVFCVHLELFGFERRRQIDIVKQHIRERVPSHESIILAGDFNDWSRRMRRSGLESELKLAEVYKTRHGHYARTYPSAWPLLSMDRIYYRGLELLDCDSCTGQPWHRLSDHAPLYAHFSCH